jgi:hypothetical protein
MLDASSSPSTNLCGPAFQADRSLKRGVTQGTAHQSKSEVIDLGVKRDLRGAPATLDLSAICCICRPLI